MKAGKVNQAGPGKVWVEQIRIDGGTQPRARLNEEAVAEYAEALTEGARLPPVTVYHDGADYWLADGFHRYHAHRKIEALEIPAEVRNGTRRDAVLHSVGANAAHGLRRTNEDKRQAVLTLLQDEEWGKWSDREIARRCGVNDKTVGNIRRELSAEIPQIDTAPFCDRSQNATRTVERNGAVYEQNTAKIGKGKPSKNHGVESDYTETGNQDPAPAGPSATAKTTPPASASPKADPSPAQPDPEPESTPEEESYDLVAELEASAAENRHLQEVIESLKKDDLAKELADMHDRYGRLEGRLRAEITKSNEAQKTATYYGKLLRKIRETLGVEGNGQIVPTILQLTGRAK